MTYSGIQNTSTAISVTLHLAVFALFLFLTSKTVNDIPVEKNEDHFYEVTLGFGEGKGSPGGADVVTDDPFPPKFGEKREVAKNEKLTENPIEKVKDPNDVIIDKNKKQEKGNPVPGENGTIKSDYTGKGSLGNGPGGYGFDLNFGGDKARMIEHYVIPEYPSGVNKEANIKLRFVIYPNGSVGNILVLTKADTRLEDAAKKSLQKWRFKPLPKNITFDQTVTIIFPFRLR